MRTTPFAAAVIVVALSASSALADGDDLSTTPDHPRLAYVATDGTRAELPLVSSHVDAVIRGPIAAITLTQRYANPLTAPIDAVYVFPLPDDAAVGGMVLATGDRKVRAVIKRRDEAKKVYDDAKRDGKMAALLDQERPNVFTQSIANLAPGEQVDVELDFDVLLAPEAGVYQLALPTVVGPRYIPGDAVDAPAVGTGTARDTTQVPDASRISPPVTTGTGNAVTLTIDLDAGLPVTQVDSPTHKLAVTKRGDSARTIALASGVTAADRDVVITWKVEVSQPTIAALADHDDDHGHVALIVQPPPAPVALKDAPARELVFVIDTSGSMSGAPLALAQAAMRRALAALRAKDRFRILNFSTSVGGLDDGASLPASADNVARGVAFVDELAPEGGTEMLSGIRAALERPAPDMDTYVVFLTDGFIGNETEIFGAIKQGLDPHTRLFSFGIGSSTNRFLLDGMAKTGKGAADYVLPGDDNADAVIDRFLGRLDAPVLSDLRVDWGGLDIDDQTPDVIPDLFAGQPIVVVGRYGKGGTGDVTITGTRDGKSLTYTQAVKLPAKGGGGKVLGRLWARRRIEALDRSMDSGADKPADADEQITQIALAYSLMSAYTSFVAVEDSTKRAVAGGTVAVPVELPAGVSPEATGGPVGSSMYGLNSGGGYGGSPQLDAPDREYLESAGGYDDDAEYGLDSPTASARAWPKRKWHGSFDTAIVMTTRQEDEIGDATPHRTAIGVTAAIERRLAGALGAGLEASLLGRADRDDVTTISAVLARWALFEFLHLRAGVGAALRFDGEVGLAWHVRAAFAVPMSRTLGPELSIRVGQARIDGDDDAVTVGVGLGVRF